MSKHIFIKLEHTFIYIFNRFIFAFLMKNGMYIEDIHSLQNFTNN